MNPVVASRRKTRRISLTPGRRHRAKSTSRTMSASPTPKITQASHTVQQWRFVSADYALAVDVAGGSARIVRPPVHPEGGPEGTVIHLPVQPAVGVVVGDGGTAVVVLPELVVHDPVGVGEPVLVGEGGD